MPQKAKTPYGTIVNSCEQHKLASSQYMRLLLLSKAMFHGTHVALHLSAVASPSHHVHEFCKVNVIVTIQINLLHQGCRRELLGSFVVGPLDFQNCV